ncbi:S1-like domain-containing RNA-binding protein [Fulvivirgaceae bacterium BMA10]|uniref:S1-like domain-containing RNA-binding protein n=1 Tax=Splendidivirga corallicola TaxID=3051826 RepID=A0ABT8KYG6_9BACT|nr:S1-like domain-containing RNA-binding protein [Fulvivirgaceae bacterium BMA10]
MCYTISHGSGPNDRNILHTFFSSFIVTIDYLAKIKTFGQGKSDISTLELGHYNTLKVAREVEFGYYLTDEEQEILIPRKYVSEETKVGDSLEVFVYKDSEDRLIATTLKPAAVIGEFVALEVKEVNRFGAFMNWGLEKDLLVPFREQQGKMVEGKKYVVRICLDHRTNRLIGVSKIHSFLSKDVSGLEEKQKVDLLVYGRTDLGFKVIINNVNSGLLYENEIFEKLSIGDRREGFIKRIREDGKIDVVLNLNDAQQRSDNTGKILEALEENEGFLALHDKSDPEQIYNILQMSKKNFKKTIGTLYKEKKIKLLPDGIALVKT